MRNIWAWQNGSCSGGLPIRRCLHSTVVDIRFWSARAVPKLPDLRELLNQAEEAKACQWAPRQSVALTPLPFTSVRDLDRQHQQRRDQTIAKCQSSPLGGEQWKRAKTPPQPDPYDAPDVQRSREEQNQGRDRGHSRTRVDRQSKLDRTCRKSRKRSKSYRRSKNRKRSKSRRLKSHKRDGAESEIDTNLIGQEFGHHRESGKCPVSPQAEPLKRTCEMPGTQHSQMTCPNSGN